MDISRNLGSCQQYKTTWFAPLYKIKPGLTYEKAQEANTYYHFKACLRIWRGRLALIACGYKNPSQRMIARFVKACPKTVRKALAYTYDQVLSGLREALYVLCSRSTKDLETLTAAFQKALDKAKYKNGEEEKLSRDPRIAAVQRRCFERARQENPPPRPLKTVVKTEKPKKDLSIVFRPGEIQEWKSEERKKELKGAFAAVFKKMHWLNRPKGKPDKQMANCGAYQKFIPSRMINYNQEAI